MAMIQLNRSWCFGRFNVKLPESTKLVDQRQEVNGISLRVEEISKGASFKSLWEDRRKQIMLQHSLPTEKSLFTKEISVVSGMVGVFFVFDQADPSYLVFEGRRSLGKIQLIGTTSGDQSKSDEMQRIVFGALQSFEADTIADGNTSVFCIQRGILKHSFVNSESIHMSFQLPEQGSLLEIDTEVVAGPGRNDLIRRVQRAISIAKADNVNMTLLRTGNRTVSQIEGVEAIISGTDDGVINFDGRFEASGRPMSPDQPELQIHLTTRKEIGYRSGLLNSEQFLSLWDEILRSITTHP